MTQQIGKFRSQVAITKEFAKSYLKSDKRPNGKLDNLLKGLNVVTTTSAIPIEETKSAGVEQQQTVLVIEADSAQNGQLAQMKVTQALFALSSRTSFTHLVSIPFTDQTFVASYLQFKDTVLSQFAHCNGINEALFQNAKKLHLTVSVLTLVDDEHVNRARNILTRECHRLLVEGDDGLDLNRQLKVKGLAIMNDDPRRTNVLYATVEDEQLQRLADSLAKEMALNGLVFKDDKHDHSVKLHITLMNTVFAKRKALKNRKRKKEPTAAPKNFDCSAILEHYREFVFAEMYLPSVQLNDVRSESEDGYYKVVEAVKLTGNDTKTE